MWTAGSWILFGTEETKKRKTIAIAISLLPDSPRLKMAGELLCGMIYSIFWRVSPLWLKHRRGMNPSPRGDESERQSANSYPIENLTYTAPIPGRGTWHIVAFGGLGSFSAPPKALPSKSGMAFVLIQHQEPRHESALATLLSRATPMPVVEVSDGMAVKPDQVSAVIPQDKSTWQSVPLDWPKVRSALGSTRGATPDRRFLRHIS